MANIFEISYLSPLKAYPATSTPGVHFDDDWFHNQIKDWERNVRYYQKWQNSDIIPVQVISSIQPVTIKLYKCDKTIEPSAGQILTLISWDAANSKGVYHGNLDLTSVPPGIYWPVFEASFLTITFRYMCEPIQVKAVHKNTSLFKYKNSLNDFGIIFHGIVDATAQPYQPEFIFRCEAAVMNFTPDRDRTAYRDQILNTTTLYAIPFGQFELLVATATGVAPWVVDLLNRIFCCDHVLINNKQFETPEGSKWEITRVKGYPLIGAKIDLVEANNRSSAQITTEDVPAGGVIVAYDIETDAFGTFTNPASANPVNIESIEE